MLDATVISENLFRYDNLVQNDNTTKDATVDDNTSNPYIWINPLLVENNADGLEYKWTPTNPSGPEYYHDQYNMINIRPFSDPYQGTSTRVVDNVRQYRAPVIQ